MADVRLIDGAKLYEFIENAGKYMPRDNDAGWYTKGALEMVMGWIKEAPTLNYAPVVHAHWVQSEDKFCYYCSHCKNDILLGGKNNYCMYCGARMDEQEKDQ